MDNLIGQRFGKLVVIAKTEKRACNGGVVWSCRCDCGNVKDIRGNSLKISQTTSCGCKYKGINRKHGHSTCSYITPTYYSWASMKSRCLNKNASNYKWYGARGIKVCDEWQMSFINFLNDMGERPIETTIDRIDPNGNYERSNCRWATLSEQNKNKRR